MPRTGLSGGDSLFYASTAGFGLENQIEAIVDLQISVNPAVGCKWSGDSRGSYGPCSKKGPRFWNEKSRTILLRCGRMHEKLLKASRCPKVSVYSLFIIEQVICKN